MIKIIKNNNKRSENYIKEKAVSNVSDGNNYSYVNEKPDAYKRAKYEHNRKMLRMRRNLLHNEQSHLKEKRYIPDGYVLDKTALEMNYEEAEKCLSIYNKLFNDLLNTTSFFKTDRVNISESPRGMTIVVQVVPKYKKVLKKVYKSVGSVLQDELNQETNCGLK